MSDELLARVKAWRDADPDPQTVAEVDSLIAANDSAGLEDRFRGALEFGTAGLRGVLGAGPNRMNLAVVRRTSVGLARYLKATLGEEAARRGVVVGRDGRKMSLEFAQEAAAAIAAEGLPVHFFEDVCPTPLCAFAVGKLKACAGVMVTASHNPPEYNGYKVYWENAAQIIPPHDRGIAQAIDAVGPAKAQPLLPEAEASAKGLWRAVSKEVGEAYLDAISALRLHPEHTAPGGAGREMSIVYTAMHGVGGPWVVEAFRRAGFEKLHPVPEQQEPDGRFPTVRFPNPEEKGAMDLSRALAEKVKAELVLANDPDADRLAVIARDSAGQLRAFTGNEVGVLMGHYLLEAKREANPLVITTIVSSTQLSHLAERLGAAYAETLTGFKWIANRAMAMEASEGKRFVFGYEEALGYSVGPVVRDKDGVGAALVFADLAAFCRARGKTVWDYLEEIQRAHGLYVSAQKSVTLPGADGAATIRKIMDGFRGDPPERIGPAEVTRVRDYGPGLDGLTPSNVLAFSLDEGSRVTLRPSGTEPKIKFYFEVKEQPKPDEPLEAAGTRARARLEALEQALDELSRARGQPS